jgi:hypothetical protein
MSKLLLLILAVAPLAAACGSTSDAAPAPAKPMAAADDGHTMCVEVMTRNRTCTDDYIPALVDLRARHDTPPGIAEAVKADRNAVIAEAKTEWAEDSKDEAIGKMCGAMTQNPGQVTPTEIEAAKTCLAKDACGEYVACITPVFENKHFSK